MRLAVRTKAAIRVEVTVAVENPALSMDKAHAQLVANGNKVLGRDDEKRTFLVAQAFQERWLEAGSFVPDVEAARWGLLPADTLLVPCKAQGCRSGTLYNACRSCPDSRGRNADGNVCVDCDGGGNDLGGPCPECGGHGLVAEA